MSNAKMVVNVLLVATIFSTAYHQALPAPAATHTPASVFLTQEGTIHTIHVGPPLAVAPAADPFEAYGATYTVTATAYQAVESQTDDEPFVTADNSFIKPGYSSKLRWLAISRDLLVHWGGRIKYGDQVQVRGVSSELDGLYTVHDTMNKRHHHCIDILSSPSEKFDIFTKGVKIRRVRANAQALARKAAGRPLLASSRGLRPAGYASKRFVQPTGRTDYLVSAIW